VDAVGGGVDVFYDQVGRATFAEAVKVLRDGGTLDLLGAASGEPDPDVAELDRRRIRITRSSTGEHLSDRQTLLSASGELFQAWRDGVFGTRRIHTYPLSDAARAHHDLEARVDGAAIVLLPNAD
jgi:NADPH:quinone reductase